MIIPNHNKPQPTQFDFINLSNSFGANRYFTLIGSFQTRHSTTTCVVLKIEHTRAYSFTYAMSISTELFSKQCYNAWHLVTVWPTFCFLNFYKRFRYNCFDRSFNITLSSNLNENILKHVFQKKHPQLFQVHNTIIFHTNTGPANLTTKTKRYACIFRYLEVCHSLMKTVPQNKRLRL